MGWSISPDTGLASIDQNGLLTYQQHTSDVTYKINYNDDEGCSATKNVTIYGCTPCNCADLTVTGKTDISKDGGSNITIGTLSKASCMSNPIASSSESWLSNITVSGNDIKATVEPNSDSSSKNGSVTVTVDKDGGGTCDKTMSITQSASGGGTTFKKNLKVYMAINGYSIATFVLRVEIRHDGETLPVYYNYLGDRNRECGEASSYSDDIDIDLLLDDELSAYTFSISVENCHGWTSDCIDDTSSYSYMINGEPSSTGGISVKLSEIPAAWQYGFIATPQG